MPGLAALWVCSFERSLWVIRVCGVSALCFVCLVCVRYGVSPATGEEREVRGDAGEE